MKYTVAAFALLSLAPIQEPAIEWVDGYEAAVKKAQAENKPLFVVFR